MLDVRKCFTGRRTRLETYDYRSSKEIHLNLFEARGNTLLSPLNVHVLGWAKSEKLKESHPDTGRETLKLHTETEPMTFML